MFLALPSSLISRVLLAFSSFRLGPRLVSVTQLSEYAKKSGVLLPNRAARATIIAALVDKEVEPIAVARLLGMASPGVVGQDTAKTEDSFADMDKDELIQELLTFKAVADQASSLTTLAEKAAIEACQEKAQSVFHR